MNILVLHGPNLNLLGRREPGIYGSMTLADLNSRLQKLARELKVKLTIEQSNQESVLVDALHKHMDRAHGAILNPAALTFFGASLHDAIQALPFPVIEVHISNLARREPWKQHSIISGAALGSVQGLGWRSYTAALRALVEIVKEKSSGN